MFAGTACRSAAATAGWKTTSKATQRRLRFVAPNTC